MSKLTTMDSSTICTYALKLLVIVFQGIIINCQTTEEQVAEGTNLYCYECKENYRKSYDALKSPCLNNISEVQTRQCLPEHKYCQVEKITFDGWSTVLAIERGCTSDCLYGCRYNGYGITYKRCFSCCRSKNCNTGDSAPYLLLSRHLLGLCVFTTVLIIQLRL